MLRTIFVILFLSLPVFAQPDPGRPESLDTLIEKFNAAAQKPCGQNAEALALGKRIVTGFAADRARVHVVDAVKQKLAALERENEKCRSEFVAKRDDLLKRYAIESRKPCGARDPAIELGKQILDLEIDDKITPLVKKNIKSEIDAIPTQDYKCQLEKEFDETYKAAKWPRFLAVARQLVGYQKDSRGVLDLKLIFVKVAFEQTSRRRDDTYDPDLVKFAEDALEKIENGADSTGSRGRFGGFDTRENALGWLNYILGYMNYFRLGERDRGIEYLYHATLYKCEFKYDAFMYQAAAIYYFDKETVSPSAIDVNSLFRLADQTPAPQNIKLKAADRQIDLTLLLKNLGNLYNLRYNLRDDEYVTTFEDYILKLLSRPLVDPSFDEPAKTDK
ncbi:MAG: hypothetical protein JSS81_19275 [Acidobacteria bacterium]|nr:hypothetical protein [Acidobacteriota bacterium]